MKHVILFCVCGRVKRFGEWIIPTASTLVEMSNKVFNGTHQREYEECGACENKRLIKNTMFPPSFL